MSDSIIKAELLERAASASDTLCEDEFHDYFQNNCPGNTWYNLDDEASELWDKMPECVVQDSYLFRALVSAVAAEAYARGVAAVLGKYHRLYAVCQYTLAQFNRATVTTLVMGSIL